MTAYTCVKYYEAFKKLGDLETAEIYKQRAISKGHKFEDVQEEKEEKKEINNSKKK